MSKDKSKEVKEELTFTFDENGKEYKVNDLSDENKLLYNQVVLSNNQRNDFLNQRAKVNFELQVEIEKCELYSQHKSNLLKDAVEGGEDKVEVVQ
jgi:hypothetical protein